MLKLKSLSKEAKETIQLLDAVFSLVDGVAESLKDDGKISLIDIGNFVGPLTKLPAAITGIENIPSELVGLSEVGRKEVLDYFGERFELQDEQLEQLIESTLRTGYEFATSVFALVQRKNAA